MCVWWVCPRFLGLSRTPLRRTALPLDRPKFRSFFSSPAGKFVLFFPLLLVLSLNFGGVFEGRDPQMRTFGVLWLSCETPAASGPPLLHTTTRELQTRTFQRPCASNTTKIPRENPQREKKERNFRWERAKKARNFGPPTLWAPTPPGPHPSGPPPLRAPTPSGPTKKKLAKCGLAKFGLQKLATFGQIRMAKSGLAKCGHGQLIILFL